jgi:Skp family chaperone for outer membrane proteins
MLPPEMQTAPSASAIREAQPESKDPPIQEATQVTVPDEASHGEPVASDGLGARQPHALIETPVRDEPTRLEHSKTSAPAVDQFAWLDAVIQVAALPQSYYLDIRQQLERGEQGREELQRKYVDLQTELAAAQAKIQQLQSAVDQVSSSNDAIQRERRSLSEALEREQQAKVLIESSMRVLQTREQGWGREREELSHRINDHAERTLADFKVALSFAISPVVRELPDIESPRLAELAPNLRVIIRQILDALADKGVEIKGAAGAAR